jgi:hypothetical protein
MTRGAWTAEPSSLGCCGSDGCPELACPVCLTGCRCCRCVAATGNWGGYWGKQGPELLDHRLALYGKEQRMVFGANT